MPDSSTATRGSPTRAIWYSAYLLQKGKRGNQFRVSIVDVPASTEWTVVDEQSICAEGSTDLSSLKAEVDRRCQAPLSRRQAEALLADLRGHVLRKPIQYVFEKYETVRPRIFAFFVDCLILLPLELMRYWMFLHSASISLRAAAVVTSNVVPVAYRILMHGWCGQTLGKMACGVVVLDVSERRLGWGQAMLREIFGLASMAVFLIVAWPAIVRGLDPYGLNQLAGSRAWSWFMRLGVVCGLLDIITFFVSKKHRALHDFIARSVVIRKS